MQRYDFSDLLDEKPLQPIAATMGESDLATLLGITASRVRTLARDGVLPRCARGRFDVRASLSGYITKLRTHAAQAGRPHKAGDELDAARIAKMRAETELAELKAAQARGDVVSAEAVSREWQSVLRDVRAAVLAVPSRYGATMPHLGPNDIAALDREVRAALEGLADGSD